MEPGAVHDEETSRLGYTSIAAPSAKKTETGSWLFKGLNASPYKDPKLHCTVQVSTP